VDLIRLLQRPNGDGGADKLGHVIGDNGDTMPGW
jgi:hypothetical protein